MEKQSTEIAPSIARPVDGQEAHDPKQLIFAWDMTRIRMLLVRDGGMDETEAERRMVEYRKYMTINAVYPHDPHPISAEIDAVWHFHVLDTPDYANFCKTIFGKFIHHNPVFTEAEQRWLAEKYDANTLPHLRALFGEPSTRYWLHVRRICWGEGGGGNCS